MIRTSIRVASQVRKTDFCEIGELKQEIADLKGLAEEINGLILARLKCFHQRHTLLSSYGHDYGRVKGNKLFFNRLDSILGREKEIMDSLISEEGDLEQYIVGCIAKLEKYQLLLSDKKLDSDLFAKKDQFLKETIKIRLGKLDLFLHHMITFLRVMERDSEQIKDRINKEEELIKKRDAKSFKDFLGLWKKETKSNEEIFHHFKKMMGQNYDLIRVINSWAKYSVHLGLGAAVVTVGSSAALWGVNTVSILLGAMSGVIVAFYNHMGSLYTMQFIESGEEEKLIDDLEKILSSGSKK